MHLFRLVLCLAGLATFLLVSNFSEPAPESDRGQDRAAELSLQAAEELNSSWSEELQAPANTPRIVLSPVEIGRLELDGKLVIVARDQQEFLYQISKPGDQPAAPHLTGKELEQLDPDFHARLLALIQVQGMVLGLEGQ